VQIVGYANDALRFALELAALAAFAYWGVKTGGTLATQIVLAVALPIVAAMAWGLLVSPKARYPLHGAWRPAFEIVYFGGAVAALAIADQPVLAAIFGGLALFISSLCTQASVRRERECPARAGPGGRADVGA
jgi:hypothetical protein